MDQAKGFERMKGEPIPKDFRWFSLDPSDTLWACYTVPCYTLPIVRRDGIDVTGAEEALSCSSTFLKRFLLHFNSAATFYILGGGSRTTDENNESKQTIRNFTCNLNNQSRGCSRHTHSRRLPRLLRCVPSRRRGKNNYYHFQQGHPRDRKYRFTGVRMRGPGKGL